VKVLSAPARFVCGALLALTLALRLLSPAGFMPAFDRGAVVIVACPDASPAPAPMREHEHGDHRNFHQLCPYASGVSLGNMGPGPLSLAPLPMVEGAVLVFSGFIWVRRLRRHERPPLRGPPIPA